MALSLTETMKNSYQRWLVALSLAAFAFFPAWSKILDSTHYFDYPGFQFDPLSPIVTLFWMFVLTPIIFLFLKPTANRYVRWIGYGIVALCLLIGLNSIRLELGLKRSSFGFWPLLGGGSVLGILLFWMLIKFKSRCWLLLQKFFLILSPFALLVTVKALWSLSSLYEAPQEKLIVKHATDAPRVVWLIFDELDIRLAFENRMGTLLPNLDRFKNESLYATQAYAAGSCTVQSIPGMLLGLNLTDEKILNDRNASYTDVATGKRVDWYENPNIFEKAANKGLRCAVIGNYHPYHKIFGEHLSYSPPSCMPQGTFFQNFVETTRLLFYEMVFSGIPFLQTLFYGESLMIELCTCCYLNTLHHAKTVCRDPNYDLIFVHWPIPHHPGIYHPDTKQFATDRSSSYFDNLVLLDDTLGMLKKDMEESNLWDATTVIVTSDHWLRKCTVDTSCCDIFDNKMKEFLRASDFRVPLLIKMVNQKTAIEFTGKMRMYHIHDIIESIQEKKVKTPDDLVTMMQTLEQSFTLEGLKNH